MAGLVVDVPDKLVLI